MKFTQFKHEFYEYLMSLLHKLKSEGKTEENKLLFCYHIIGRIDEEDADKTIESIRDSSKTIYLK